MLTRRCDYDPRGVYPFESHGADSVAAMNEIKRLPFLVDSIGPSLSGANDGEIGYTWCSVWSIKPFSRLFVYYTVLFLQKALCLSFKTWINSWITTLPTTKYLSVISWFGIHHSGSGAETGTRCRKGLSSALLP